MCRSLLSHGLVALQSVLSDGSLMSPYSVHIHFLEIHKMLWKEEQQKLLFPTAVHFIMLLKYVSKLPNQSLWPITCRPRTVAWGRRAEDRHCGTKTFYFPVFPQACLTGWVSQKWTRGSLYAKQVMPKTLSFDTLTHSSQTTPDKKKKAEMI